jgi:hypothetical protein
MVTDAPAAKDPADVMYGFPLKLAEALLRVTPAGRAVNTTWSGPLIAAADVFVIVTVPL